MISRLHVEYAFDLASGFACLVVASAIFTGAVPIPDAEPGTIGNYLATLFLCLLAYQAYKAARDDWLRLHGIEPVAVALGLPDVRRDDQDVDTDG